MNLEGRQRLSVVIGAVIMVALQIILAPSIAIGAVLPNFLLSYVLVVALVCRTEASVLAFVLGMIFNLIGGGPVGAMAFLLLLFAFVVCRVYVAMDNDTLFIPIVILVASIFLVEFFYSAFMVAVFVDASIVDAFVYRSLPCALYDSVLAIIMYPFAMRYLVKHTTQQELSQLI